MHEQSYPELLGAPNTYNLEDLTYFMVTRSKITLTLSFHNWLAGYPLTVPPLAWYFIDPWLQYDRGNRFNVSLISMNWKSSDPDRAI